MGAFAAVKGHKARGRRLGVRSAPTERRSVLSAHVAPFVATRLLCGANRYGRTSAECRSVLTMR
jgi:hypothetical protein